jgi:hypothetical protein
MSDGKDVHELAGGWITERKGTQVPAFLKLTYVGFCLFGLYYLYGYWQGEVAHESRGPLVQLQNQVMETPGAGFHALIFVCVAAFTAGLLWFALVRKADAE